MIFQDGGRRPDLLGSLRGARHVIVTQHVQGELETELLSKLLQPEHLAGAAHV